MKKIFLFSVLALGAMLFSACDNQYSGTGTGTGGGSQSANLDALVESGKYVGMDASDVIDEFITDGWTKVEYTPSKKAKLASNEDAYYTKTINGIKVNVSISSEKGQCRTINFDAAGVSNYMQVAQSLYNKIGDTYYFTTEKAEAPFTDIEYYDAQENEVEIKSYEEGKAVFAKTDIIFLIAYWWSEEKVNGIYPAVQVACGPEDGEVEENDGKEWVNISFGSL